ncbi:Protein CBG07172 [Caenorhabditis briggsae]|uniref:Protein CBG07172 n=1 Tax=Caenorhabditis briggsae TaxID=6238 RepID=A8X3J7_CAEBR|nr:Protein CBG07172 [Caenorhabditis briggsae]CAP27207.1 Protein CBG07172 [Caenorhabditis briggsae]
MVTVRGAPEPYSSFPMSVNTGAWDECVQICFLKYSCFLAYSNSSLMCVLYGAGDVRKIRNDQEESETLEKVSFKIETTNKCSSDPSGMFDGMLSSFKNSKFNTAEIITSENYYEVKIISENITDCGMQIRPEIDFSVSILGLFMFILVILLQQDTSSFPRHRHFPGKKD